MSTGIAKHSQPITSEEYDTKEDETGSLKRNRICDHTKKHEGECLSRDGSLSTWSTHPREGKDPMGMLAPGLAF